MIKINKDLKVIPVSLNKEITQRKREELIAHGGYINEGKYNDWYKKPDVKAALIAIYHYKCAFCEQKVEQFQVEHFRPKSIYYWLAYSWDNLLLACPTCNVHKKAHFEILDKKVKSDNIDFDEIHGLAVSYNKIEQNLFAHPEQEEEIQSKLIFDFGKGKINSKDKKVAYTIEKCQLNREFLSIGRAEIFKEFVEKITKQKRLIQLKVRSKETLKDVIQDFIDGAENPKKEFLAFKNGILESMKNRA